MGCRDPRIDKALVLFMLVVFSLRPNVLKKRIGKEKRSYEMTDNHLLSNTWVAGYKLSSLGETRSQ